MRSEYCGLVNRAHLDRTLTLCGWVHRRRDHGGVIFIDLRDREGLVQVVCDPDRPETFKTADGLRNEFVIEVKGRVRSRPAGTVNPELASGEVEVLARDDNRAQPVAHAGLPDGRREPERERAAGEPRARPAPSVHAEEHAPALPGRDGGAPLPRQPGIHRHRDPDADALHARRRARLPGAVPRACGRVLRAAAVAAALQADADGRRLRPLLPDRALLPRRGPARRPPAGVHADRHRDLLPRPGRDHADHGRPDPGGFQGSARRSAAGVPAPRLRRRDGALRQRQAGPARDAGADRADRRDEERRVQGVLRTRQPARRARRGAARAGAAARSRAARSTATRNS